MANFGQSARIYLADGVPTGIRLAEIINWTGQAIACPRIRIGELAEWSEVSRQGIYFLLQDGLGVDKSQVYIGESEDVRKRLGEQLSERDFWVEAICFTNKDDNLTKAHVRYLEARLIHLAKAAGRYEVRNGNNGTNDPKLPRADKAAMEEFIVNLRVLLSLLGHRLLEPLVIAKPDVIAENKIVMPVEGSTLADTLLHMVASGLNASGYATDEGFTLLKGSQVKVNAADSTPKNVQLLRNNAVVNGELVLETDYYRLVNDKAFSSSSAASCFVAGNSSSGPTFWKDEFGVTLRELEQQELPPIINAQPDSGANENDTLSADELNDTTSIDEPSNNPGKDDTQPDVEEG